MRVSFVAANLSCQVLEGHSDEIFSCAFNYEGDTVITGSKERKRENVKLIGSEQLTAGFENKKRRFKRLVFWVILVVRINKKTAGQMGARGIGIRGGCLGDFFCVCFWIFSLEMFASFFCFLSKHLQR